MARPGRNAVPENILQPVRIFFVTTKTSMGQRLFQSERNAGLFVDVLRSLVTERAFQLHDFVVMPDHIHLLVTILDSMTIEKALQLVKGRFSFRLKREFGVLGEIWQRGFSEVQVMSRESFDAYRKYIADNPVKAGLVDSPEQFPFCFRYLADMKTARKREAIVQIETQQGLKPASV